MTGNDLCQQAMQDAGLLGAGDVIKGDQINDVLSRLNRLFDSLNADDRAIYAEVFNRYTLTPNLSPHTIGPTGTLIVTQRPMSIDGAMIVDTTAATLVKTKVDVRDWQWYKAQPSPTVSTSYPQDLFYELDWPNGKLYLWPVPTVAYQLELWTRTVLAQMLLTDTFTLPPGYWDFIVLTLAENICVMWNLDPPPTLAKRAEKARALIYGANTFIPRIATHDAGMPSGNNRPSFDYQTGQFR